MTKHYLDKISLPLCVVTLELQATGDIYFDKFPSFIIRSAFGNVLRRLCQFQNSNVSCINCSLKEKCPSAYIFETPAKKGQQHFSAENYPHPFVFQVLDVNEQHIRRGAFFKIELTLFGDGIAYLPFYVHALDVVGETGLGKGRGRFLLQRIYDNLTGKELYCITDKTVIAEPVRLDIHNFENEPIPDRVVIKFVTPAKILYENKVVKTVTPEIFIKRLLGRARLLAEQHTHHAWAFDHHSLIAEFIDDVKSAKSSFIDGHLHAYSARQKHEQRLDAIFGGVTFYGNLSPYWPLLRLGEHIHIGSATSKGLGKYKLYPADL